MFKNHLIIAYRNFIRHKLFSFINIFGLGVGLGVCMMISLWVINECRYDRFHENAGRIFRVERELFRDNLFSRWPITGGVYKQALIDDLPEVENAVRFWKRTLVVKDHQDIRHQQGLYAVDNSIFYGKWTKRSFDGRLTLRFKGRNLAFREVLEPPRRAPKPAEKIRPKPPKYDPPPSHPWRHQLFGNGQPL